MDLQLTLGVFLDLLSGNPDDILACSSISICISFCHPNLFVPFQFLFCGMVGVIFLTRSSVQPIHIAEALYISFPVKLS